MISVVSYDIWRTLLKPDPAYAPRRAELVAGYLGVSRCVSTVAAALKEASSELDAKMDETGEQFGFAPRIELTAAKLGLAKPSADLIASLEESVNDAHLELAPTLMEPNLVDLFVRHWDEGRMTAVISNTGITSGKVLRDLLAVRGLLQYIDIALFSDEVGVAKPNEEIFVELIKRAEVFAAEIVHVGDNRKADYAGATHAGLNALLYTGKEEPSDTVIASHWDMFDTPLFAKAPA